MKLLLLISVIMVIGTSVSTANAANSGANPTVCNLNGPTVPTPKAICARGAALIALRKAIAAKTHEGDLLYQGATNCARLGGAGWRYHCTFRDNGVFQLGHATVNLGKAPAWKATVVFGKVQCFPTAPKGEPLCPSS